MFANNPRIVTDGLKLCLDAGARSSYPGSGTTWYDITGNGYNASLNNGPAWNSAGYFTFDGGDDTLTYPNPLAGMGRLGQTWTVAGWVNLTYNGSALMVASGSLNYGCYLEAWTTNKMILYLNGGDSDMYRYSGTSTTSWLFDAGWVYVEFKFSNPKSEANKGVYGGTTECEMWVNRVNKSGGGPNKRSDPYGIGSTWTSFSGCDGKIKSLLVYDRWLSNEESEQNYVTHKHINI
jgi:hypothetical protein